MKGFIYVMSNESFRDGILKIGISSKDPTSERANELYTTGVPKPFKVEYYAFVEDYKNVEEIVHSKLKKKRLNRDREFFNCSVPEAIDIIRDCSNIKYQEIFYKQPEEIEKKKQKEEEERERKKYERKERERKERERKERENWISNLEEKFLEERRKREQRDRQGSMLLKWIAGWSQRK